MATHHETGSSDSVVKSAFVLDDHTLFTDGFALLLESTDQFEKVDAGGTEAELQAALKEHPPTHLFLDYHLPDFNALEVIKKIRKDHPDMRIIMISSLGNTLLIQRLLKNGLTSFVSKNISKTELLECLRVTEMGRSYISKDISLLLDNNSSLQKQLNFTNKEIEILQFIAKGFTIEQTAKTLHLSTHTIVSHRRNMMAKAELSSASALVKLAYEAGLISS